MIKQISLCAILSFLLISCGEEDKKRFQFESQGKKVPQFNADSAYSFIQQQVEFGPRNPNSRGHRQTVAYLLAKLQSYAGERAVYPQRFTAEGYEGDSLQLTNIIAAFNTASSDRVLLCAHWDTRPRADKDSLNADKPIVGADDGGSGVGVLLELARIFKNNPPPIGVDIVLFDGEDYGREGDLSKYFLGSRYWSDNPPVRGYAPRFGILLDMVGAENAQFPKELNSMYFAPELVDQVWAIADEKNASNLFLPQNGSRISDDHVIINQKLGIPTINIIHHNSGSGQQFASYWHTHRDDMSNISRETLGSVGSVLTELIYNRIESPTK